jgi:hypothetical protein
MSGACDKYGVKERCIQGFGGATLGGTRPLERPKCRLEYNIKMEFK